MKYQDSVDGFTLVELIVVILLVGIISAIVIPNLSLDSFRQTGGFQQGIAAIRFGQKLAITSGCQVDVSIATSNCTLTFNGCTGAAISNPGSGNTNFCNNSDPGVNPSVNFSFDNIGAPVGGEQNITFAGGQTVRVEANTGFAYEM